MPHATAVQTTIPARARGVYSQPFGEGRVYFNVTSDGAQGSWRVPIGAETEAEVIEALGDDLDRRDPLPRPVSRPRASFGSPRVLRLHRD
jgi:hypothetical protein